jgi:hypothetical protein
MIRPFFKAILKRPPAGQVEIYGQPEFCNRWFWRLWRAQIYLESEAEPRFAMKAERSILKMSAAAEICTTCQILRPVAVPLDHQSYSRRKNLYGGTQSLDG